MDFRVLLVVRKSQRQKFTRLKFWSDESRKYVPRSLVMSYFLDTNILLRTLVTDDPNYQITMSAIASLKRGKEQLFIAPQNLIELWNAATRPAGQSFAGFKLPRFLWLHKNGLGLSPDEAQAEVARLKELFVLLPDREQIYPEWERLVKTYKVKGAKVHDTRLVAFMLVHRLSHILTFNVKDFRRFSPEITPVSPTDIINS